MTIYSDKLRELVDTAYPEQAENLNKSRASIQEQIDELNSQKEAFVQGVLEVVKDQLVNDLLPAKTSQPSSAYVRTFGSWGLSGSSGNAEDWQVYELVTREPSATFTQDSPSGFVVDQNITGKLSAGQTVVVTNGGVFSAPATTTTVTLTAGGDTYVQVSSPIVAANVDGVWKLVYEYQGTGWDNDPTIQSKIDAYAFTIDHLHADLGTGGTYGILALRDALLQGRSIITKNLNKISGAINTYDDFGT